MFDILVEIISEKHKKSLTIWEVAGKSFCWQGGLYQGDLYQGIIKIHV